MQAYVNEKVAPEVLEYQGDLVDRVVEQIRHQVCTPPPRPPAMPDSLCSQTKSQSPHDLNAWLHQKQDILAGLWASKPGQEPLLTCDTCVLASRKTHTFKKKSWQFDSLPRSWQVLLALTAGDAAGG